MLAWHSPAGVSRRRRRVRPARGGARRRPLVAALSGAGLREEARRVGRGRAAHDALRLAVRDHRRRRSRATRRRSWRRRSTTSWRGWPSTPPTEAEVERARAFVQTKLLHEIESPVQMADALNILRDALRRRRPSWRTRYLARYDGDRRAGSWRRGPRRCSARRTSPSSSSRRRPSEARDRSSSAVAACCSSAAAFAAAASRTVKPSRSCRRRRRGRRRRRRSATTPSGVARRGAAAARAAAGARARHDRRRQRARSAGASRPGRRRRRACCRTAAPARARRPRWRRRSPTLGAELEEHVDIDQVQLQLTVLSRNLAPTLTLLGDSLARPRFDAAEWQRAQARRIDEIRRRDRRAASTSPTTSSRACSTATIRTATRSSAPSSRCAPSPSTTCARSGAAHYGPTTVTFVLVGDVDERAARGAGDARARRLASRPRVAAAAAAGAEAAAAARRARRSAGRAAVGAARRPPRRAIAPRPTSPR